MGTEHGPHNPSNRAGRPAEHPDSDLKLPSGLVAGVKARYAAIDAIAAQVSEYCDANKLNRGKIVAELRDLFEYSPNQNYDRLLAHSIVYCTRYKIDFRAMFTGFTDIVRQEVAPAILHPDHLILWGALARDLRKAAGGFPYLLVPEVLSDTVRLLEMHVPPRVFRLYCANARAISQQEQGLQKASDRISELSSAMIDLLAAPLLKEHVPELEKLCDYEVNGARAPDVCELIEAYAVSIDVASTARAGARGPALMGFLRETTQKFMQLGKPLAPVIDAVNSILAQKPSDEFLKSLGALIDFHVHPDVEVAQVRTIVNCVRDLSDPQGIPELMQTYQLAREKGVLSTPADSIYLLQQLAAQSALYALSFSAKPAEAQGYIERLAHYTGTTPGKFMSARPGIQEYMREQARYYRPLRSAYGDALQEPEPSAGNGDVVSMLISPAQRALLGWRRLCDFYLGFGALTYESRRLPSREPPLIARFGSDLGKMYYINANDVNGFPGRGYAIGSLDLKRVFPADPAAKNVWGERDPFAPYKKAWPTYAHVFEDLARAEFIYTRAMMVVSVPDAEKFGLRLHGKSIQYSLVLFNSHHANPTARIAALVPSAAVAAVMKGTLINYEDFRGFDTSKPDLNQVLGNAEHFLKFARKFGPVANIGHPKTVSTGILPDEHKAWGDYLDAFDQHLADIKKWDSAFRSGHRGVIEAAGGYLQERVLLKRAGELEQQRESLLGEDDLHGDKPLWDLTHQLLDVLDLMRIVQARWHRGYTLGAPLQPVTSPESRQNGEQNPDPDETVQDFDPAPPPTNLVHDAGDDVYLNRSAQRMVHEAYSYHRMRSDPKIAREGFPILAVVDALNYARNPELAAYLDTYDMTVTVGTNKIPLTPSGLTIEDEIFLAQHFLPRAADKPGAIGDLRFLNRRYVGIE